MKKHPFTDKIIHDFFKGILPEEQHHEVIKWFSSISEAEQRRFMDANLQALENSSFDDTTPNTGFESLANRIEERSASRRRSFALALRIAASLFFFVFCWFLFQQTTVPTKPERAGTIAKFRLIRLNNPLTVVSTIQLPDSSTVDLYPGATLQYPQKFSSLKRDVQLEGKAFFSIKHQKSRPFTVQTGMLKTIVLGTSFWVDATKNNKVISVKVKTGKVGLVSGDQPTVFLLPSERAVFDVLSGVLAKVKPAKVIKAITQIKSEAPTAIVFNNTPLQQVAIVLSESFGKSILVQESLGADLTISLTTKGKSITAILQEIKLQIPIDYEIENNSIFIKKQQ